MSSSTLQSHEASNYYYFNSLRQNFKDMTVYNVFPHVWQHVMIFITIGVFSTQHVSYEKCTFIQM